MTFDIKYSDVADMEIEETYMWIFSRDPIRADEWQSGLDASIRTLAEFPTRCPLAFEDEHFPFEVRQHLFGRYRVLFTLLDTDNDGIADTVRVLHVRHGARRRIGEEEE